MKKLLCVILTALLAMAVPVCAANLLTNGDFSSGTTGWNEWCGTHFSTLIETTGYQDTWVRDGSAATVDIGVAPDGAKPHVVKIGMWRTDADGKLINSFGVGGLCQTVSVTPGKYYRVSANFKGVIDATGGVLWYNMVLGLVDGSFNPGVWSDEFNPPTSPYDSIDKFKMECGGENAWNMALSSNGYAIPEFQRWWHNRMAERNLGYNDTASWDWMSTLNSPSPRTVNCGGIKKATQSVMTVVLQATVWADELPTYVEFDNVVLEEVPGPTTKLGDLGRLDMSAPYGDYPEIVPQPFVDIAGKVVTGSYMDWMNAKNYFYVEEADRTAGIRVDLPDSNLPAAGDVVSFSGVLGATDWSERNLTVDSGWQKQGTAELPKPVSFALKSASAKLSYLDPFAPTQIGPANTGLLARVTGTVKEAFNDFINNWVRIDDGSGVAFWINGAPSLPDVGKTVAATGTVGVGLDPVGRMDKVMMLQVRSETASDDFTVLN